MLRNCASRARSLSRFSVRELSSLNKPLRPINAKPLIGFNASDIGDLSSTVRLFSSGKESSHADRRAPPSSSSSAEGRRPSQQTGLQQALKSVQKRPAQTAVTLSEAGDHVSLLFQRLSELGSLPPVWSKATMPNVAADERETIFRDAQALLYRIENAVNTQQFNPSGKHGRELSHLLGQILEIYSKTAVPFGDDTSVFDACCQVLTLLQEWNLDILSVNYTCSVEVAARESRWKEASILFSEQIDPDANGQAPMEITRHLAVGLYCIARNSQIEGGATVDHVMDAVLKMSMVCPTDQDHYVLSAGVALGHTGEGESFANYLKNSYNSSRLGEPLTGAVMNACFLSGNASKALELFHEVFSDPLRGGSEWQYGGEYNSMNPLCRDVAMRALGEDPSGNLSDLALELYQQVKNDDFQISIEALCGVVKTCEREGRWGETVEILTEFLGRCHEPTWLVVGNETTAIVSLEEAMGSNDITDPVTVLERALPQVGSMVASVMRACNAEKKFGMSILCSQLACDTLRSAISIQDNESDKSLKNPSIRLLSCFEGQEDPIVAAMVSLSGLHCEGDAVQLYSAATERYPSQPWYNARNCYKFMQTNHFAVDAVLPASWENAQRHIYMLLNACSTIERINKALNANEIKSLAAALSRAMRTCTAAGQPETSLWLTKRVYNVLTSKDETSTTRPFSFGNAVATFFGYPDSQPYGYRDSMTNEGAASLGSEAAVLAETIRAYRTMGRPDEGLELLDMIPDSFGCDSSTPQRRGSEGDARWIPVVNQAIFLLSDEDRIDDAYALFKATNERTQDHETLIAMATAFEKGEQWTEIVKLYYHALNCGLLSERLAVLAMKAVVETRSKEQPKQLRLIAKSACALFGMNEEEWVKSRYWHLERFLGFKAARLLMWWGDASTAHEMKLHFVIEQTEARQKAGLTPKNAALRYIMNSVRQYKGPTEVMPLSRLQWFDLLRAVLAEAEKSSLWYDAAFVESACLSLYWLGGKIECVEFARDAVARGVQITQATVDEVTEVCRAEGLPMDDLLLMSRSVN